MKRSGIPNGVKLSGEPEPAELLAASIVKLADGIERLTSSGLSSRAMEVLLKDCTGVSRENIRAILEAAPRLRAWYLAKPKR